MQKLEFQILKATLFRLNSIVFNNNSIIFSRRRWYYTKPNKNNSSKQTLYSKISPLGHPKTSVSPVLDEWVQSGKKKASFAELQRILRDLRKRRRFSQALEVSEWILKQGLYPFRPSEHAVHLDLIGRVHGYISAESYFDNLSQQEKTEKTYGALLHSYVRQNQIEKSLLHLEKMKENGITLSTKVFNDIMCLYTNSSQAEKVLDVLTEMKDCGISPDNLSYRLCINSYGSRADIDGIEKILEEMENQSDIVVDWNTYAVTANYYINAGLKLKARVTLLKAEARLDNKESEGYNHLISLHAKLGNKADIIRLWDLEKSACKRCINKDYINMLNSLVRLGELGEAEKLLVEWESSGNYYDFRVPNVVILGYISMGLFKKAEVILENLVEKGKTLTPNSWARLLEGYLDNGEVKNAVECMKAALSVCKERTGWKPHSKMITRILDSAVKEGSFEDVHLLLESLRNVVPLTRQIYHALLESCIRNGKEACGILKCMRDDNIDQNEETEQILSSCLSMSGN